MDRVDDADNFIESLDTIFVECERYFADLSNQISGQYLLERLHRAHHSILLLVSAWPESERQSINTYSGIVFEIFAGAFSRHPNSSHQQTHRTEPTM